MVSDLDELMKKNLDYSLKNGDDDSLISIMCSVYAEPCVELVRKHRTIIENSLLRSYKDERNKIYKALNITGRSDDEKWRTLMKKTTSSSLIDAYIRSMYNEMHYFCPHCHSRMFELVNDRRCGTLFVKAFVLKDDNYSDQKILWQTEGCVTEKVDEKHFWIVPDGIEPKDIRADTDIH